MRTSFFVKDTAGDVACEQALCLGKKNREEREGKGFQPLCGWKSKLGQKAHRSLRISKNFLQLPLFLEDFVAQYLRRLDRRLINVFAEN